LTIDVEPKSQRQYLLATAIATRGEKRLALLIGALALAAFVIVVPSARVPLAQFPAFIPSYEAALFFIDLITAVLLFDQFVRLRSFAVLILAVGYLFDALMIVPHALSFPGAFAPTGLLGAKDQTTAWLYVFWHGGFPLFVIGYALLRRNEVAGRSQLACDHPRWTIIVSIALVAALAVALALLTTAGHDWLPLVMRGSDYSLLTRKGISPAVWLLTVIAITMLWQQNLRVIDLWLMLVMWVWLFDIALAAIVGANRFDLGFYAGRIFGLIAASLLLVTLIVETTKLYAATMTALSNAELRFLELLRSRARASPPDAAASGGLDSFIQRQNITRYRALLESGQLSDDQRRSIEKLLSEEERNLGTKHVSR
jgi:hypothetical protein